MRPANRSQHFTASGSGNGAGKNAGNGAGNVPPLAAAIAALSFDASAGREAPRDGLSREGAAREGAARDAADQAGLRTQGVVEAGVCEIMTGFVRQILGRGPTEVRAFVVEDMLLVRLRGTLTAAEKQLSTMIPEEKGRDLVKGVRAQLVEGSQCQLRHLIESVVESRCLAIHHDVSTVTGEQMFVFALESRPACRDAKPRK
jgi:uncharacterized protein YbcI